MRRAKTVSILLLIVFAVLAALVLYEKKQTIEIAVPLLGEDGKLGAKMIRIRRSSGILASTLVKIRGGGGTMRDALYHTQSETVNGQRMIHGPSAPDDLHLADCAPTAPMAVADVFQGVGPGNANAWGYRYADKDAVAETECVRSALNANPPQSIDLCFFGPRAGKFIGQADGFAFVNPTGTLDIALGDSFALFVASMKVVPPQTSRNQRCTKPSPPVCGDWFIDSPETCDDGNTLNNDGCSSACQIVTQCSDGVDNDGDTGIDCADPGCHSDGNAGNPGSCVPSDNSEAHTAMCGNTFVDAGEQCDDGNASNFDSCRAGCILNVCGDGFPARVASVSIPGEPCDDGNTINADGCTSACITEPRYNCEWDPTISEDECTIPLGGI